MANDISVVSLNVRGLNDNIKRNTVYTWLKQNKHDICFLQETYCSVAVKTQFNKHWNGDIIHSISNSVHSRGVCILLNSNLNYKIISYHSDNEGRIVLVNLEIDGHEYTFVNIYAPNTVNERISFFKNMSTFIHLHSVNKNRLFVGGDFNCVLTATDRVSGKTDNSTTVLNDIVRTHGLVDAWKCLNPNSKEFTYIDSSFRMRNSRIDFIFCSDFVKSLCLSSSICQAPAPDHKAVCLRFKQSVNTRGKGYWKFNNSFLIYEDFDRGVKDLFSDILGEYGEEVPKCVLWDYVKLKVKEYCIMYGITKAQRQKKVCADLEKKLDELDKKISENYNENIMQDRKKIKEELDEYYKEKSKGYQIRSRAKWVDEGEQSTKYFFNLEKVRQNHNCIISLKDERGENVTADKEILDVAKTFYTNLFQGKTVRNSKVNSFFDNITPENVLTEDLMQKCEGVLNSDECFRAVTSMKRNKSPGLDGLTVEFYQHFWTLIGDLVVDTFNEGYENGCLSESQRIAVLSLIFKKGDTDDISNYRPISLTNVDYRILAFVLSNRLQSVIDSIVSHDQTAYIRNRYMGYNIKLIQDIVDHYEKSDKGGIIFMADFQKAFDSLEWEFLFKTLEFFNFGPSFMRWVKMIYTLPLCKIKNNGFLSDQIHISRGVRQGCPVSALLFILCIEMLGIKVRQHRSLHGFDLGFPQKMVKISQYADDCVLFLNNKDEFCIALQIFRDFGLASGLVLNLTKCEGLWLGIEKHKQNKCTLFGIKWPEQLRCLGIFVGYSDNTHNNWYVKIEKVEGILKSWKNRDLSLFGRVQIIKTFAISQFVLPASLLVVPPDVTKRIEGMLFKFLWGSNDKIKRSRVVQELKYGGLNMVDVNILFMSLKAVWISRLLRCDPNIHNWSQLPYSYYNSFLQCNRNLVFNFDSVTGFHELQSLNPFYRDALLYFNSAYVTDITEFKDNVGGHCIWANKHITVRKRNTKCVLFLRNWIRSGVNNICDLDFVDGKLNPNSLVMKIRNKSNIAIEMKLVQDALLPYREYLKHVNITERHFDKPVKSRYFYEKIKENQKHPVRSLPKYLSSYCDDDENLVAIFTNKIILEKEIKLKEFNYKLLHGILPCNINLRKWKIKESCACDVCGLPQTIEHLLYDCIYVKPLWYLVEEICNETITFQKIIGVDKDFHHNNIVTLICFLIYKEWLLLSLQDKGRNRNLQLLFFKFELNTRLHIYQTCSKQFDFHLKMKIENLIAKM